MRNGLVLAGLGLLAAGLIGLFVALPQSTSPNSIEHLPVYQNAALLREAWNLPVARWYGPDGYTFQRNPSVCGPTSIADLLRSEGRRASPEQVLDGTGITSYFGILPNGMTLDQEAAVLRLRTGKPVAVLRGLSLEAFRNEIAKANDISRRYIVNFSREPLFGRGHGHFSPVLGYLAKQDLVFIGDVNGDYRPWFVPTARLYAAQDGVDFASHEKRGLLRVTR